MIGEELAVEIRLLREDVTEMKADVKEIKVEAKNTNGRVTLLEQAHAVSVAVNALKNKTSSKWQGFWFAAGSIVVASLTTAAILFIVQSLAEH